MDKLNILIVDDKVGDHKKIKDILNHPDSILKDNYVLHQAYFVKNIPEKYSKVYSQNDVFFNVINGVGRLDLALVDLNFEDEFPTNPIKGAEIIIPEIKAKFPYCEICILSDLSASIAGNRQLINGTDYPAIAKRPNQIFQSVYNNIFTPLLEKWTRYKLSQVDEEDQLAGLLKTLKKSGLSSDDSLSFKGQEWKIKDLLYFFETGNKQLTYEKITTCVVDMPRLKEWRGRNKIKKQYFKCFKNTTVNWQISFIDLFQNYIYSQITKKGNSFDELSAIVDEFLFMVINILCKNKISNINDTKTMSKIHKYFNYKLTTQINVKAGKNGAIPHSMIPIFREKLIYRMVVLNLYCLFEMSASGISYLLIGKDYSYTDNHNKTISQHLGIGIPDQKSTKIDNLIYDDFKKGEIHRKEEKLKHNIREMNIYDREYDFYIRNIASYELKNLKNSYSRIKNNLCGDDSCVFCSNFRETSDHIKESLSIPQSHLT